MNRLEFLKATAQAVGTTAALGLPAAALCATQNVVTGLEQFVARTLSCSTTPSRRPAR